MLNRTFFYEFEYLSQLLTDSDDYFIKQLLKDSCFRIGPQHVYSFKTLEVIQV